MQGVKGRKTAQEKAASQLKVLGLKAGLQDGVTPEKDIDLGPRFKSYLLAVDLGMWCLSVICLFLSELSSRPALNPDPLVAHSH